MMLVHIQHFLDNEGQDYFVGWLAQMGEVLERFPGFVSLTQLHRDGAGGGECHLLLEFDSDYHLNEWSNSYEYRDMLQTLAPYQRSPCVVKRFTLGKRFGRS